MRLSDVLTSIPKATPLKFYFSSKKKARLEKLRIGAKCYLTISKDIKITKASLKEDSTELLSLIVNKGYSPTNGWLNTPDDTTTSAGDFVS